MGNNKTFANIAKSKDGKTTTSLDTNLDYSIDHSFGVAGGRLSVGQNGVSGIAKVDSPLAGAGFSANVRDDGYGFGGYAEAGPKGSIAGYEASSRIRQSVDQDVSIKPDSVITTTTIQTSFRTVRRHIKLDVRAA